MEYPNRFLDCLALTLGKEGGISNDPDDRGGLTAQGISTPLCREAFRRGLAGSPVPTELKHADVLTIYYEMFWKGCHADEMEELDPLDFFVFDMAVNCGVGQAIRNLQEVLNDFLEVPIAVDGAYGPKTRTALFYVATADIKNMRPMKELVARIYQHERGEFYDQITDGEAASSAKRAQEIRNRKFYRGWHHQRVYDLEGLGGLD